uniref:Uncharacterized protein n=1 Tax=Strigamia maritima TaxID=126957 RepID=T1JG61_STRMM
MTLENDLCDSVDNLSLLSEKFLFVGTNSQLEKDAGAVFAAITEVIRSQNGKETVTEYVAAMVIITYLETVDDMSELDASMYLISKMMNRVPAAVLNVQFSKISSIFMNIISKNADSTNALLLQNTIRSLSILMKAQELAVWNHSIATHIFKTVLSFSTDSRPKIRKVAQAASREIIKSGINKLDLLENKVKNHPACDVTAEFCLEQLSQYGASKDQNNILHTMGLVRLTLEFLPAQRVKSICESLLQLMTIGNTLLKTCCLQTLRYFLVSRPRADNLPASMTAKLITALYNYVPSANDVVLWKLWLPVMLEAHYHLNKLDENLCFQHLPFLFETAVKAFMCESLEIHAVVADCLKGVLNHVIEPVKEKLIFEGDVLTSVRKCFELIEGALRFQYQASWNQVLLVIGVFYEVSGLHGYTFMTNSLKKLGTLCENENLMCFNEAKYAIGSAVRSMGPQTVLEAIQLELEMSSASFRRGWIISVLQQNIRHADFSYFVSHLKPIIEQLQKRAANASSNNQVATKKTLVDMEIQVWSLLPAFCTRPINVVESFKKIAQILGTLISTRPNVRLHILSGIRTLINQDDDAINTVLGRYSKNFMPIFFNLYATQSNEELTLGERLAVYETLKVYLKITDSHLIESLHQKLMTKLTDKEIAQSLRHAFLDLILVVLPYLNSEQIKVTYNKLLEHIKSDDRTVRKKVYRFIEELCSCDSESCKTFVRLSLSDLQSILGDTLESASPATKATVVCIKEPSTKARSSALALLVEIGNYFIKISASAKKDGFKEFIHLVVAGIAGTPKMINASVLALCNIIREFTERVREDMQPLIDCACSLMQYPNRQVVDSAILLLKSILASFSEEDLFEFSEKMVTSLTSMPDDIKRPFRFKTKEVLVKLVKKFGYLRVIKLAPDSLHGIIKKINKDLIREKRNKADKDTMKSEETEPLVEKKSKDDLMDSDDENESNGDVNENAKSETNKLWLREKGAEEVINFLDPSAFKNITATKHKSNAKAKNKTGGFQLSNDGKLIIVDDEGAK